MVENATGNFEALNKTMSTIIILIGASLFIAGGFLIAFIVAAKNGQFDDSYTPSVRMLFDDDKIKSPDEKK
jgi:cbb3-type cytochrome oxidase maturation protein